jgi:signal transduction histidine kinase
MQRNSIVRIEGTCRELLRLIANVLEIAKIEAGEMPVTSEPVLLAELVDEVAAEYGPLASEVGRHLKVAVGTDLPPAVADRVLLKRVLVNLIVNALRHSGSTDVCVEAALEAGAPHIAIRVVDHGRGIPEADQAGIFEKFKTMRGDQTADTGLGLPFCKLAVERMQGHIALRSAPSTGTAFIVTLPRQGMQLA